MYFLIMKTKSLTSLFLLTFLFFHISFSMVFADDFQDAMDAANRGDAKEAVRSFRLSAAEGNEYAQYNLGHMYAEGQGVPQNYKEAFKWFRIAAEQGMPQAKKNLGYMYQKGQGVPQDYKEAVKWYRLSVEQGFASAQYNLGVMYEIGQGVLQDYALAHMWFNLCGSSGDKGCVKNRDIVENKMSPSQIEKAQDMARNWKPNK